MNPNRRTHNAFSALAVAASIVFGGCEETDVGTPQPSPATPDGATPTPDPSDAATETSQPPGSPERERYNAIWGSGDNDIWASEYPS